MWPSPLKTAEVFKHSFSCNILVTKQACMTSPIGHITSPSDIYLENLSIAAGLHFCFHCFLSLSMSSIILCLFHGKWYRNLNCFLWRIIILTGLNESNRILYFKESVHDMYTYLMQNMAWFVKHVDFVLNKCTKVTIERPEQGQKSFWCF